jgi:hypothetical protein
MSATSTARHVRAVELDRSVLPSRPSARFWLAACIWNLAFAVGVWLFLTHRVRAIPYGVYTEAADRWLNSQSLYELKTIDGFQYFPQSAMLFVPLARLGSPIGDLVWRALSWYGYAFGIWRWSRELAPQRAQDCFLLATCFAVLCASGSLGNGQANLALAALMLHASADLSLRRFTRATLLLTFGLCLKPLMAVMLLLAWPLYRALFWRVPLALGVAFALPWVFRDHTYVVAQYADSWTKLQMCADPDRLFEDLRSLNTTLGLQWTNTTYTVMRALAALMIFVTCGWVRKRVPEPWASLYVSAFAAGYLMLFNPRTLSSSYAMPMSAAALLAALFVLDRDKRAAVGMLCVVGCWTVNHHVLAFVEHWLRPLACMVFLGLLVADAARRSKCNANGSPYRVQSETAANGSTASV